MYTGAGEKMLQEPTTENLAGTDGCACNAGVVQSATGHEKCPFFV